MTALLNSNMVMMIVISEYLGRLKIVFVLLYRSDALQIGRETKNRMAKYWGEERRWKLDADDPFGF